MTDSKLLFTGPDHKENWLYNKWYCSGGNARYFTWNIVFNLLNQRANESAVIVETGCQRLNPDIGGGESTTIFCEYINRYGGSLNSVDISPASIRAAKACTAKYDINKRFHTMDSVKFLSEYKGQCDLLYLDSWDYPYGELLNAFGGQHDIIAAEKELMKLSLEEIDKKFDYVIQPCQQHCLNELNAAQPMLKPNTIILIDDNQLPGGGKPRLAKEHLLKTGWVCLLDFQQSLWIKEL